MVIGCPVCRSDRQGVGYPRTLDRSAGTMVTKAWAGEEATLLLSMAFTVIRYGPNPKETVLRFARGLVVVNEADGAPVAAATLVAREPVGIWFTGVKVHWKEEAGSVPV